MIKSAESYNIKNWKEFLKANRKDKTSPIYEKGLLIGFKFLIRIIGRIIGPHLFIIPYNFPRYSIFIIEIISFNIISFR